jgi:thiamine biosynthesis lipoprotein
MTMGTSWSAVVSDQVDNPSEVQSAIQEELTRVDHLMSNWIDTSDVCRFNDQQADKPLKVSKSTAYVLKRAVEIFHETDGTFDPTLGPLIELWGFARKEKKEVPAQSEIDTALKELGMDNIQIIGNQLVKSRSDLFINLSAIAKGYGVDAAYSRLEKMGFKHFLVEVGGEIRVKSRKNKETLWRIGIETPHYDEQISRDIYAIAQLENTAMATSGDYRNFFQFNGKNYSHIIDPTTGYPADTPIASATVIAPDCTSADAYATAFMVLPPQKSLDICNAHPELDCLIIERNTDQVHYSKGMKEYLAEAN